MKAIIKIERRVVGWEVYLTNCVGARDQMVAADDLLRQRLFDLGKIQTLDDVVEDRAQLFGADVAELAIDRHAAARVNRLGVVIFADELVIGILDFKEATAAALPLAIE